MTGIIVAIITGVFSVAGVIISNIYGNKQTERKIKAQTDLTLYRIRELEKKQDKHNTLIERMYKLEDRLNVDEEKIKVANHRIESLENKAI